MRRLLAILLLAAFGLPAVAPLAAMAQDPDSHLPACCRRNGAHHCNRSAGNAPTFSARCQNFPQQPATASHITFAAPMPLHANSVAATSTVLEAPSVLQRCLLRERSHPTRGPPAAVRAA